MTTKVIASTSGIDIATTRPARKPRLMKLMASTMTIASNRARVKPETASSTIFGWSDTRWISAPTGRSPEMRAISFCSASPNLSRLAPGFMPMVRPIAGLPLNLNSDVGGST